MIRRVVARAYANIALVKYWGKIPSPENLPATPSISLALDKLFSETVVERHNASQDEFFLDGSPANETTHKRLSEYLQLWRNRGFLEGKFIVQSKNSFPTAAGLASSASGFAALATALAKFAPGKINRVELSQLARRGSGSASRSIPGGLAAMPVGSNPGARLILKPEKINWGMTIAVTQNAAKPTGSTSGMESSRSSSPYYKSWVIQAKKDYQNMLAAIKENNFTAIGNISESNALAMHACMIATRPSLLYWNETTINIIKSVQKWRSDGLEAYITIDAGAHVAIIARIEDLTRVADKVWKINGVDNVFICHPAGGASVLEWD